MEQNEADALNVKRKMWNTAPCQGCNTMTVDKAPPAFVICSICELKIRSTMRQHMDLKRDLNYYKCEGCGVLNKATHSDIDGVRLCDGCWDNLKDQLWYGNDDDE